VPLTPEDVSKKRFATARLFREGYDMTEVDQFLDEVEAELRRLIDENGELRGAPGQAAAAPAAEPEPAEAKKPESAGATDETTEKADDTGTAAGSSDGPAGETSTTSDTTTTAVRGPEVIEVTTTEQASTAVARMLEIAGRNADELLAEARSQAETIVSEATSRAEKLDAETEERRSRIVADLERDHRALQSEVEDLRTFEREYRAQLRNYFQQQLDALDAQGGGVTLAEDLHEDEGEIGSRLRSILESEEQDQPAEEAPSDAQSSEAQSSEAQSSDGPAEGSRQT
jgi:DivIVA domain-containing protein